MTTLSVILITKNEEQDLPECLESLRDLGAEIVIIDSGSQDGTVEIARRRTPHVYVQSFRDFATQKQSALDRANGEWVLSIDADERISPELTKEIQEILAGNPSEHGFTVPFEIYFLGRRLRFGGLGSERHLRLFRRAAGRFTGEVHEGVQVDGIVGRLNGAIRHFPYRNLDEYIAKLSVYTTVAARERKARGERFTVLHHLLPAWEFFVRTIVRLGMLDGTPGIAWAGLASFHTWIKYLKLRELEKKLKKERFNDFNAQRISP